jgi:hypothetical protein
VVTGEDDNPRALKLPGRADPLAGRHPDRQVFEPAKRSGRLGQPVLSGAGSGGDVCVGRGDLEVGHDAAFTVNG